MSRITMTIPNRTASYGKQGELRLSGRIWAFPGPVPEVLEVSIGAYQFRSSTFRSTNRDSYPTKRLPDSNKEKRQRAKARCRHFLAMVKAED